MGADRDGMPVPFAAVSQQSVLGASGRPNPRGVPTVGFDNHKSIPTSRSGIGLLAPACCRWVRSRAQFGVGGGLVSNR